MKYFLFSALLAVACAPSEYKGLQPISSSQQCYDKLKPTEFVTSWFDASVDVEGHHIGGLLLMKKMPDQSHRVVFTSEAGATIFDFEYKPDGSFNIRQIIKKLDRKIITKVLRKDFAVVLGIPFHKALPSFYAFGEEIYSAVPYQNESTYLVTDKECNFKRLEHGGKKKMFSATFVGTDLNNPDQITIKHHTFDMIIELKKINKNAS